MSSTLHRFTPPTCTLEIKGIKSPLSRWTNQDLLKKFHFQLNFDDPRLPTSQQVTITGNKAELEELKLAVDCYVQNHLHASLRLDQHAVKAPQSLISPYLKPDGLVNHQLLLGNLKSDATANIVKLSTVQLFDLLTALDAYSATIASLPTLQQIETNKVIPLWCGLTAATLAVLGITAISIQSPPKQVASEKKTEPSSKIVQLDEVIPPQIPETIKNKATQPRLNQTISSAQRLPSPPAVETPKPKPNIPDPADYPLTQVEKKSGLNNQSKVHTDQIFKSDNNFIPIPKEAFTPKKAQESNKVADNTEIETLILKPSRTKDSLPIETDIAQLEDKKEAADKEAVTGSSNTFTIPQAESNLALNFNRNPISQSAQIKAYFRDKWQPPEDLKQSLEYRLYLNDDGSIKKVIPLGKASRLYLSKTNIPVQGEPFISPVAEDNSIIRLLLNPDGAVITFQE